MLLALPLAPTQEKNLLGLQIWADPLEGTLGTWHCYTIEMDKDVL